MQCALSRVVRRATEIPPPCHEIIDRGARVRGGCVRPSYVVVRLDGSLTRSSRTDAKALMRLASPRASGLQMPGGADFRLLKYLRP